MNDRNIIFVKYSILNKNKTKLYYISFRFSKIELDTIFIILI